MESKLWFVRELTDSAAYKKRPPKGAKMMPTTNKVGRTVFGVSSGCQAFNRCCLKAVSGLVNQKTSQQVAISPGYKGEWVWVAGARTCRPAVPNFSHGELARQAG